MSKQKFTPFTEAWARVQKHYAQNRPFWLGCLYGLLLILILNELGGTLRGFLLQRLPGGLDLTELQRTEIVLPDLPIEPLPKDVHLVKPELLTAETFVIEPKTEPIEAPVQQTQTESQSATSASFVEPESHQALPSSSAVSFAPKTSSFSSKEFIQVSSSSEGLIPISASSVMHEAAPTDFPAFGNAVHPVSGVPNWGAMTTPSQWERRYDAMEEADFVPIPRYELAVLTAPMETYLADRPSHIADITAKLYYSTRHMGRYDLDAGEYTGTHAGVDLKLAEGTAIGTVAGGRVVSVGNDTSLGLYIVIEHRHPEAGTFFSIYGHLETAFVTAGDDVRSGEAIGRVGTTGQTTAPHVHLQIDRDTGVRPHVRFKADVDVSAVEADRLTISPIEFISRY